MRRTKVAKIVLMMLVVWMACSSEQPTAPGIVAPKDPIQETLQSTQIYRIDEYIIRPVARFSVEARVLGKERYLFDRGADLSPVDLALGWGRMSDQAVLDHISISQGGRFYYWKVEKYPIPRQEIIEHSANMHLIPANDEVKEALLKVRVGEIVNFEGFLVVVTKEDGFHWKSSLTRRDSGDGACELVYVEKIFSYPYSGSAFSMDN